MTHPGSCRSRWISCQLGLRPSIIWSSSVIFYLLWTPGNTRSYTVYNWDYTHTQFCLCCVVDVDECAVQNGGCPGVCNNLPGSYTCSCVVGDEDVYDNGTLCTGYYNIRRALASIVEWSLSYTLHSVLLGHRGYKSCLCCRRERVCSTERWMSSDL